MTEKCVLVIELPQRPTADRLTRLGVGDVEDRDV